MRSGGSSLVPLSALLLTTTLGVVACSGTGHRGHPHRATHPKPASHGASHRTAHPKPGHRSHAPPHKDAPHREGPRKEGKEGKPAPTRRADKDKGERAEKAPAAPVTWGADGGAAVETIDVDEEVFRP